ncbi:hypothetical protein F4818DRAFT_396107 [Hypoxylon cercidicola]|nr:hypothetical protein F4818DRAFT_396107 [Hypoxylon cercidicola]
MSTAQGSFLQRLPLELRWHILESISDVRSLASAALTCRALYSAFKAKEDDLPSAVLANCVGHEVLREAEIVHQCCPPFLSTPVRTTSPVGEPLDAEQSRQVHLYAKGFIRHLKRRTVPTPRRWNMSYALAFADYHLRVVVPLTQAFVEACASEQLSFPCVDLDDSLRARPATRREEERVMRALYRFELFRKLFGRYSDGIEHMPGGAVAVPYAHNFFKRFAPWEIAQLAVIHDFLGQQVMPAFADIAEHDIQWAAFAVNFNTPWNRRVDHPAIQHLLTLGLQQILRIASCYTFKSRIREVLGRTENVTVENHLFFDVALRFSDGLDRTTHGKRLLHGKPFHVDGDTGPRTLWTMTLGADRSPFYDSRDWLDRRWGYVMWDCERLRELGVLDHAWSRADAPEQGLPLESITWTLEQRRKLWHQGGRGYWALYDESRVVYPNGRCAFETKETENTESTEADTMTVTITEKQSTSDTNATRGRSWFRRMARRILRR